MKLRLSVIFLSLLIATQLHAAVRLVRTENAARLEVDGKPMLILGGELGNSSATCAEDIARIFPKLKRMQLNTVLVPAYWDLTEPEEGKFDFSLTETVIDEARKNDLKVIFLWFGAWKNSMSCYTPLWFKTDFEKYPRAHTRSGKPLEIASAFSSNVFRADSTAFTRWLGHLDSYDKDNTVLSIQIENEIGMLEDARDHSDIAEQAYTKGLPARLCRYINKNGSKLHPHLKGMIKSGRIKPGMPWAEAFGDSDYADEIFMAWSYADYVQRLACAAKKISSRPLYVNAAMDSRGRRPGEYPSAGPLAKLKDIWFAAAPDIDFISPDIYDKGFTDWVKKYDLEDNVLFIPEIRLTPDNGTQAFYVFGEHDAIGMSPFSIENGNDDPESANVEGYTLLRELEPLIIANQGAGRMNGLYFDGDSTRRVIARDGMKITASHFFTLPWDPRSRNGSIWPAAGGIIIRLAPMEYLIAGSGIVVEFEDAGEESEKRALGEDGFAEKGSGSGASLSWRGDRKIGIGRVAEVKVNADGSFTPVRYFNGDETHQGRHVRIGVDDFKALHVKLYEYR